jgi:hypothetical protein
MATRTPHARCVLVLASAQHRHSTHNPGGSSKSRMLPSQAIQQLLATCRCNSTGCSRPARNRGPLGSCQPEGVPSSLRACWVSVQGAAGARPPQPCMYAATRNHTHTHHTTSSHHARSGADPHCKQAQTLSITTCCFRCIHRAKACLLPLLRLPGSMLTQHTKSTCCADATVCCAAIELHAPRLAACFMQLVGAAGSPVWSPACSVASCWASRAPSGPEP